MTDDALVLLSSAAVYVADAVSSAVVVVELEEESESLLLPLLELLPLLLEEEEEAPFVVDTALVSLPVPHGMAEPSGCVFWGGDVVCPDAEAMVQRVVHCGSLVPSVVAW